MSKSVARISPDEWRREFAVTERYAFLDHASLGPIPRSTVDVMHASLLNHATQAAVAFPAFHTVTEDVRGRFARLVGTHDDEIAITANTATGISVIAKGLEWREGDNVVVPAIDFPSNMYAWMQLSSRGVETRRVLPREGRVLVEDLLSACDSRTRVVAVSLVQFSTGFRVDIDALGQDCRARGILLVVDGMQGIGWMDIHLEPSPIDAMALQSYKWLLGPFGVGWLYVRRGLIQQLEPLSIGGRSMTPRDSFLDHRFELSGSATRFESGVLDLHSIAGAGSSIDLLAKVGIASIEAHTLALAHRLAEGLIARGYILVNARTRPRECSPIVVFRHASLEASTCHSRLREADVIVSLREGMLRASPHFYNNENDVDRLLNALP